MVFSSGTSTFSATSANQSCSSPINSVWVSGMSNSWMRSSKITYRCPRDDSCRATNKVRICHPVCRATSARSAGIGQIPRSCCAPMATTQPRRFWLYVTGSGCVTSLICPGTAVWRRTSWPLAASTAAQYALPRAKVASVQNLFLCRAVLVERTPRYRPGRGWPPSVVAVAGQFPPRPRIIHDADAKRA